ncbi:hypothetical protein SO802_019217 [Lithocarpus litseifolius]|uniref:Uncharacterized protein n=1 Tax=Lithocarpus litseifolius TaxID=425828 RepID=A0AAW2CQZ0_9ROSI
MTTPIQKKKNTLSHSLSPSISRGVTLSRSCPLYHRCYSPAPTKPSPPSPALPWVSPSLSNSQSHSRHSLTRPTNITNCYDGVDGIVDGSPRLSSSKSCMLLENPIILMVIMVDKEGRPVYNVREFEKGFGVAFPAYTVRCL